MTFTARPSLEVPAVRGAARPALPALRSRLEMQQGPFRHGSAHASVPLTELEEALLVGAGAGFTGLTF